jgi:glucose-6-phosphate isomerase
MPITVPLMSNVVPFSMTLGLDGTLSPCSVRIGRRLSDMATIFADRTAVESILAGGNPVLYEVCQQDVPAQSGQLIVVTTVIHPGKIGDEFYMTKGHFHARRDTAEVYLGLQGHGYLLMCTPQGAFKSIEFRTGTVGYIAPGWAHRMVNAGDTDFSFFGVYPADAGHDYATVESLGFPYRMLDDMGSPTLVPDSTYGRR